MKLLKDAAILPFGYTMENVTTVYPALTYFYLFFIKFHFTQGNACFFVNDQRSANALRSLSGSITVRDGSKLFIQARPCPPPKITSTDCTDGGGGSINQDVLKVWRALVYHCLFKHLSAVHSALSDLCVSWTKRGHLEGLFLSFFVVFVVTGDDRFDESKNKFSMRLQKWQPNSRELSFQFTKR